MLLEMNVKLRREHFNLSTQLSINAASVGLFGKSGAGKSTLLGLIAGTIQPQSGHIVLDGKTLYDSRKNIAMPREQRLVGAVLQQDTANASLTVKDSLNSIFSRSLKQRRLFTVNYLVELLDLGNVLNQFIEQLSSGETQRVALAHSLLESPRLLLLDDTFASIGNHYRLQLIPVLKHLQQEFGLPVLYASQCLGELLEITDQLIIIEQGQIQRSGSLQELAKHQNSLRYLGIRQIDNILTATLQGHNQRAGCSYARSLGMDFSLPLRPQLANGSQTKVSIRANDIALSRHFVSGISIQNQIKGRICALISCGESLIVQVDCGVTLLAEITHSACHEMSLTEGDNIYCLIKTHAVNYVTEMDALPHQRVFNHEQGRYYLNPAV